MYIHVLASTPKYSIIIIEFEFITINCQHQKRAGLYNMIVSKTNICKPAMLFLFHIQFVFKTIGLSIYHSSI